MTTTAKARSRHVARAVATALLTATAADDHSQTAAASASASDAHKLEAIVPTADRKHTYRAAVVQVVRLRGARQLDTPLTTHVIPNTLIQSQQPQRLLDALRNTAGVSR